MVALSCRYLRTCCLLCIQPYATCGLFSSHYAVNFRLPLPAYQVPSWGIVPGRTQINEACHKTANSQCKPRALHPQPTPRSEAEQRLRNKDAVNDVEQCKAHDTPARKNWLNRGLSGVSWQGSSSSPLKSHYHKDVNAAIR